MSSIGVVRDLSEFFLAVGYVGAGIALLCAIIAAVALARAAAGVCGGAVAVWIGGALLSLAAGFSGEWMLLLISVGALVAALTLGGVARAVLRRRPERPERPGLEPLAEQGATAKPAKPRRIESFGGEVLTVESIR